MTEPIETPLNRGFIATAFKQGNSTVVAIPKDLCKYLKINPKDKIDVMLKSKLNIYNFRFSRGLDG